MLPLSRRTPSCEWNSWKAILCEGTDETVWLVLRVLDVCVETASSCVALGAVAQGRWACCNRARRWAREEEGT